ncbi:uncharacterized protein LOC117914419 [Vitis riparia]|uniref:uncharacterized protein LOC117914419 n=1 Tax=Vitis riparia TaxID=96939 RepID=UPI00155AC522|nr:uncharacterized protein LOC117914419 [Vitis riparia]
MAPDDEEKTSFITPHGLYCYRVMPFGLKNVGATYQRLMTKIFKPLIGDIVEVYIDDVVVKSKTRNEHTQHLQKVFHLLRKYGMKLNPAKCTFGISSGKFLGFMVTQRGIEVNPDQVKAVANMPAPTNKKQLQCLTGKLVTLGRFIARFTDKMKSFFLALRNINKSGWTSNCQRAFEEIKRYLSQPPILSSPQPGERLYLYLALTDWADSAVLLRSLSPREQRPVYFISKALADAETRYSRMEQTALALRMAAQKLRPYFQAHPITVLTNQPLRNILHKPDITGRMLRWAIELSEYRIGCQPRLSLKGQVMADFIAELPEARAPDEESTLGDWWSLYVDGASRSSESGVGLLLKAPTGEQLEQSIRLDFPASNNEAEYEANLSGLNLATTLNASKVKIHSDSQLVVGQILKEYETKDERMAKYSLRVQESLNRLEEWIIEKIPRGDNVQADALAGIAASFPVKESTMLPVYVQTTPTIAEPYICTINPKEDDWAVDIRIYLQTGTVPENLKHAHKVRIQASRFTLIRDDLYRRSFGGPYLRCLIQPEIQYVLSELHEGVCGNHSGGRTLAHRAHSQGYYWPTMRQDAVIHVKKCDKCQKHASIPHMPAEMLNSVTSPWPFAQWGMDIMGPFPTAPAQKKFLLVATDYFSKWVEAEAYASIKDKDVKSNSQAEATNKTLLSALKKRLEKAKGKWVEELPGVLWAYCTTPGRPTGNTPFALAYGTEVVIPTEVAMPTVRTAIQGQRNEDNKLARHLDWADEAREAASIRMAAYQQKAVAYYNRKVRPRIFKEGSLVLRKVFEDTVEKGAEKFQANWEGPYMVSKANENGSYHLRTLSGAPLL